MQLFGWDLKSLWQTAHQKRCHALLQAGRLTEAHEAYRYMMDMCDEATTVNCSDWIIGKSLAMSLTTSSLMFHSAFEQECRALYTRQGDTALSSNDYDKAIELYSAVIDLHSVSEIIFVSRCNANLGKMLWEDALLDAQKVRWYLLFHRTSSMEVLRSSN
jgi:tetratricopeptide (TPR) repeat protein